MMWLTFAYCLLSLLMSPASREAFVIQTAVVVDAARCDPTKTTATATTTTTRTCCQAISRATDTDRTSTRRNFLTSTTTVAAAVAASTTGWVWGTLAAQAVGPVKIALEPTTYRAVICPPEKPIPGEKAMEGMRGLCVTVEATLQESSPKDLEKVGVYGFVTDGDSGDSVLANNPDGGTDAGQFAMIESVTTKDKKVVFEFIAAVPRDKDLSQYQNGIGPLDFSSLRIISYPGGQQFGAISPCEMNEFSDECEAWEAENGPYEKAAFMIKSNPRTKGY